LGQLNRLAGWKRLENGGFMVKRSNSLIVNSRGSGGSFVSILGSRVVPEELCVAERGVPDLKLDVAKL
jgi:hypothetical protein